MTTPNEDQNLQEQPNGTEAGDETDDENVGWTNPEEESDQADGKPNAEEDAGNEDADETEDEEQKPAPEANASDGSNDREKALRDKYSMSKNEAETLRKAARKLEADGLLDRDEIAEAIGVKKDFLDAVLDKQDLPEVGEDGHVSALQERFVEDFNNPTLDKAAERLYGDKETRGKILKAFDYAVQNDPKVREKYLNASPDDVFYLVMDEGKAALDTFNQAQELGGPAGMMAEIARLRAENAELKKKPVVNTQAQKSDEDEEPDEEHKPAPQSAREARIRAMMN